MIKDIEEESKTKFSIKVEFSFSFKVEETKVNFLLPNFKKVVIIYYFSIVPLQHGTERKMVVVSHLFLFLWINFRGRCDFL